MYSSDHMCQTISPEIYFLLECCKSTPCERSILNYFTLYEPTEESIKSVVSLASQHGVLPLVYKTLKKLEPHSSMSDIYSLISVLIDELKAHYQSIAQKNIMMSAELIRILNIFSKNQIDVLAFKGPSLAQAAYGDITLRQFGDLDILVKREELPQILQELQDNGYIPEIELNKETEAYLLDTLNVIALYKASNRTYLEVHWELLSKNYAINWDTQDLWTNRSFTMINHQPISILPPEHLLLYLCTHGSKHLFERIEWICDIDRHVQAYPNLDWVYILELAKKQDIERMLYLGLSLSNYFFDLPLPTKIQQKIEQDRQIRPLLHAIIQTSFSNQSSKKSGYRSLLILLSMRIQTKNKLAFLFQAFFAPQYDDFKHIKLPTYLIFLYPLIRLYRLITKYFPYRSKIVN